MTPIRSRSTIAAASTAATSPRRRHSARAARSRQAWRWRWAHRWTRSSCSDAPLRCRLERALHIPDASLSASGAPGSSPAGRHAVPPRDGYSGSELRPGAVTRAGGSRNTPGRNRCCRDRTADRCAPVHHSDGSCRAGRAPAAELPTPPPASTGQRRGEAGIKERQIASSRR